MTRRILMLGLSAALASNTGCKSEPQDPRVGELRKAVPYVRAIVGSRDFRQVAWQEDPEHKPSTLVRTLFSDIGASYRPTAALFPDGMNAPGAPLDLVGIALVQGKPEKPWSAVVRADDAQHVVLVDGYGDDLTVPLVHGEISIQPLP